MKKLVIIAMLLLLVIGICACDPNGAGTTPTPSPTEGINVDVVYMRPGDTYRIYMYNIQDQEDLETYYDSGTYRDQLTIARGNLIKETFGVDIVFTPWKGSYFTEYCGAAASGEPLADILYTVGPHTLGQLYMWDGIAGSAMLALSDYDYVYNFSDDEYWDVDAQKSMCEYGGKLYFFIPRLIGDNAVNLNQYTFYNKKVLASAGYTQENLVKTVKEGNWNWDYFKQVAINVNDPDKQLYALVAGQENSLAYNLMVSNGGDYIKKQVVNGLKVDRFAAHESESLEAWNFFLELNNANVIMPKSMGGEDVLFRNGKTAMMLTYLNRSDEYDEYPELEFGILPIPKAPDAEGYVSAVNWFMPYGLFKNIPNPEGAVQFAGLFFAPKYAKSSQDNIMLMQSELSVRLQDQDSIDFAIEALDYSYASNMLIYQMDCSEYMWYATQSFINGETTPAQYYASVTDAVNAAIDKYNGLAD